MISPTWRYLCLTTLMDDPYILSCHKRAFLRAVPSRSSPIEHPLVDCSHRGIASTDSDVSDVVRAD